MHRSLFYSKFDCQFFLQANGLVLIPTADLFFFKQEIRKVESLHKKMFIFFITGLKNISSYIHGA